jgi:uncharacterized SAM-binding protein YcdF (DUF218 family)
MGRWEILIRSLGIFVLSLFLVITETPITRAITRKMAVPEKIRTADAIVVLGAGLSHQGQLREESLRRLLRGLQLYKTGFAPVLVVLGNSSEIELRAQISEGLGVPADAIAKIETNTTTREEASKSALYLAQRNGHRVLVVTEALHMRRAQSLFERAGLEVSPAVSSDYTQGFVFPADRLWLAMRLSQEFTAVLYYRAAGYI